MIRSTPSLTVSHSVKGNRIIVSTKGAPLNQAAQKKKKMARKAKQNKIIIATKPGGIAFINNKHQKSNQDGHRNKHPDAGKEHSYVSVSVRNLPDNFVNQRQITDLLTRDLFVLKSQVCSN